MLQPQSATTDTTDTDQKGVLKVKPGEKRLFVCFDKPLRLFFHWSTRAPFKDFCRCVVYYHTVCFDGGTTHHLQQGSAEKTQYFKQLLNILLLFGGGHVVLYGLIDESWLISGVLLL